MIVKHTEGCKNSSVWGMSPPGICWGCGVYIPLPEDAIKTEATLEALEKEDSNATYQKSD